MSKLDFLEDDMRHWIDWRWGWLDEHLGPDRLRAAEVPVDPKQFVADRLPHNEQDIEAIAQRIAHGMGIADRPIRVVLYHEDDEAFDAAYNAAWADGTSLVLGVGVSQLNEPLHLAIRLAAALTRSYLQRLGVLDPEPPDYEILCELAAIYLGGGVILANNEFITENTTAGGMFYSGTACMSALPTQSLGYALARFAHARQIVLPDWERKLKADPKGFYKKSLAVFRDDPPANQPDPPQWYIDAEQGNVAEPEDWTDEELLLANAEDYKGDVTTLYCMACAHKFTLTVPGRCPACGADVDPEDLRTVSAEKPTILSEAAQRRIALLRKCVKWGIPLGIVLLLLIAFIIDLLTKPTP